MDSSENIPVIKIQKNSRISAAVNTLGYSRGITLIELLIILATIVIILSLALPIYSNYSIRAKVKEAVSLASKARNITEDACLAEPTIEELTNTRAGYTFQESPYIKLIEISGPCTAPVITITTQNTGAQIPLLITLTGDSSEVGKFSWICTSSDNYYAADACRS